MPPCWKVHGRRKRQGGLGVSRGRTGSERLSQSLSAWSGLVVTGGGAVEGENPLAGHPLTFCFALCFGLGLGSGLLNQPLLFVLGGAGCKQERKYVLSRSTILSLLCELGQSAEQPG